MSSARNTRGLQKQRGGLTERPKKVKVTPPKVQVLETSADDPKGSACTSTKSKYKNQSKYYSASIHTHTNLCGCGKQTATAYEVFIRDTNAEVKAKKVDSSDEGGAVDQKECEEIMCGTCTQPPSPTGKHDLDEEKEQGGRSSPGSPTGKPSPTGNHVVMDMKEQGGRSSPEAC